MNSQPTLGTSNGRLVEAPEKRRNLVWHFACQPSTVCPQLPALAIICLRFLSNAYNLKAFIAKSTRLLRLRLQLNSSASGRARGNGLEKRRLLKSRDKRSQNPFSHLPLEDPPRRTPNVQVNESKASESETRRRCGRRCLVNRAPITLQITVISACGSAEARPTRR